MLSTCHWGLEIWASHRAVGQSLFGDLLFRDYRADWHVTGFKPINCELWNWNCSFSFIFFCLLNIEVWMLFKLLLMLIAHLGCIFSHMYWFLIKAWYCNRLFVFSLIKQFLSLVSKVLGYELEVKGTKWLAHRCSSHTEDELCEFSIHGGLWSTACFPRLRTLDSWTCSGIGLAVHTAFLPQPPRSSLGLVCTLFCGNLFISMFSSNSEKTSPEECWPLLERNISEIRHSSFGCFIYKVWLQIQSVWNAVITELQSLECCGLYGARSWI